MQVGRSTYDPIAYRILSAKAWQNYEDMRRDPVVRSCLELKTSMPIKAGWKLEPAEGTEESEQVEWTRKALENLNIITVLEKVMDAVPIGYSALEKVWGDLDGHRAIV